MVFMFSSHGCLVSYTNLILFYISNKVNIICISFWLPWIYYQIQHLILVTMDLLSDSAPHFGYHGFIIRFSTSFWLP